MAEKVIRYMEETLRKKDSVIDKLRLKNATLKSQIAKVEGQLKQKARRAMNNTAHATAARVAAHWCLHLLLCSCPVVTPAHAQEEMGDVLHYIDFHQLQIENKQVRDCRPAGPDGCC